MQNAGVNSILHPTPTDLQVNNMPEPLDGITVIEMTIAVQGPAAGLYLRDMGALVIKVEPPMGDGSRYTRGRQNETPDGTMGPQYVAVNRGKRSICIDLKTDCWRKGYPIPAGDRGCFPH